MTEGELTRELAANSRQLTAALDAWIDCVELHANGTSMAGSIRALCLIRARELYKRRAELRQALRHPVGGFRRHA